MVGQNGFDKAGFFDKLVAKFNKPGLKNKTNFFRLFSVSQRAGLGMIDALNALLDSESNKGMRIIIEDLVNQLIQGVELADAMTNHAYFFSSDEIELIRSSQLAGNLVETLNDIADNLEQSNEISNKIKKAFMYPVILFFGSIAAALYIVTSVLPNILTIFPEGAERPKLTDIMMAVSDFIKASGLWILVVLVALVVLFLYCYRNVLPVKIAVDSMLVKAPIISPVIKGNYMYNFAKLLSQFYSAGMSPVISLQLISNIFSNYQYKKKVIEIRKDLEAGFSIFEGMEGSKLFDSILIQIIHVGESTGTTKEVLSKIAFFYKKQLETRIDIMMAALEPILMVFIAGLIGSIVGSIILPMASVVESM